MKNLEQIKLLADKLPKEVKANALALVDRMGTVIEGIGDNPIEWRPEILKILQGTSDRAKYGKNVPIGSIIVGEDVLEQPLDIYPIRAWKARQYWSPDQNEAKMLCSSPNAVMGYIGNVCKECPHSKWEEGKGSECSQVIQVAVITSDLSKFFIVNFSKTAYVTGTSWMTTMSKAGVLPYKRVYTLSTETHKQYKNVETLVVTSHKPSDKRTPDECIPFLDALFAKFTADRTEHLEAFMQLAEARGKQVENNKLTYQGDGDQAALPAAVGTAVEVEVAEASGDQTVLAQKYSM